jgi:hypothetical protein
VCLPPLPRHPWLCRCWLEQLPPLGQHSLPSETLQTAERVHARRAAAPLLNGHRAVTHSTVCNALLAQSNTCMFMQTSIYQADRE